MPNKSRNTWRAKIKRTITSSLPVAKKRQGGCANCGACCHLPNTCLFLKYRPDGKSYCSIHKFRPLNCLKYPRTKNEFITEENCGYKFD